RRAGTVREAGAVGAGRVRRHGERDLARRRLRPVPRRRARAAAPARARDAYSTAFLSSSKPGSIDRSGTTTISMRRFDERPSSVSLGATGRVSPYEAADSRFGPMPAATIVLTIVIARPAPSCQFDGKRALWIGTLSVWPSTWNFRSWIVRSTLV